MSTETHSDRAIAAAIKAFGPAHPTSTAVALFIASARHLNATVDDKRVIAELAYQIADDIVGAANK